MSDDHLPDISVNPHETVGLPDNCPHCGVDLRGAPIPADGITRTHSRTHYSNAIGMQIRGVYDGVLFYQCPACDGRWRRFELTHPLYSRATPYVERSL